MKIKYLLFVLVLLYLSGGVFAEVISENFNFYSNEKIYEEIISPSVKVEISTIFDTHCRYDDHSGVDYEDMGGRFDLSANKLHEKTFTGLGDGIYTYYVKCDTTSLNLSNATEMELVIRVNSLVSSQIVLDSSEPLKAGRTGLTLLTSKVVSNSPSLTYSFDGIVYNDLPLFGEDKVWKGYLIIPKTLKETVVSFKFSANDLEGRQGTEITSGNVFLIDTIKPSIISDIDIAGFVDGIDIDWDLEDDEDILEYNIYRSEFPGVERTDFYTSVSSSEFNDKSVDRGETYYYRIAGVDEAGNEGDLSKEVYATVLQNDASSGSGGLSPSLIGKVDNFIVEVESNMDDLENIRASFDSGSAKEKEIADYLDIKGEIDLAKSGMNSLLNDAKKFKLQDLDLDELENKLNSLRVKLEVIKKKVPDTLIIKEDATEDYVPDDDTLRRAILLVNGSLSENQISNILKETNNFDVENNFSIKSRFFVLEILNFDGTTRDVSLVIREISGDFESGKFIEAFSSDLVSDENEINLLLGDGKLVGNDLTYSFPADITDKIVYSIDRKISLSRLEDSKISYLKFVDKVEKSDGGITGYFVGDFGTLEYGGLGIGVIILIGLVVYFVFLRRKKLSESGKEVGEKIDSLYSNMEKKNFDIARKDYLFLREKYKSLEEREKKIFHKDLEAAHKKLIAIEIEEGIAELEKNKDERLFKKIDLLYSQLDEKSKKKIEVSFMKVKKDFIENA